MSDEPTPRDYETAERKWNEKHNVGFDELDSFDQYILAGAAAKVRKNGEETMADFCPGCGHDTDHTPEECPAS